MWIARNSDNSLCLFYGSKPQKSIYSWNGVIEFIELDSSLFPEVKWEDKEPTEVDVEITITKRENL